MGAQNGEPIRDLNPWFHPEIEVDFLVETYQPYFESIERVSKDMFEVTSRVSGNSARLKVTPRGLQVIQYTRVHEDSPMVNVGEFWESIDQLVFQMDPNLTADLLNEKLREFEAEDTQKE